jgi:hypothetical protein
MTWVVASEDPSQYMPATVKIRVSRPRLNPRLVRGPGSACDATKQGAS